MSKVGRPPSGKRRSQSFSVSETDSVSGVSYEDAIVAKYLEELCGSEKVNSKTNGRSTQHSNYQDNNLAPYLQKVVHTHIVPVSSSRRTRPTSAKSEVSVYTDDSDILDISSASELGSNRKLRNRPQSAPASKRSFNGQSSRSRPSSAKPRSKRSLYMRIPHPLTVLAARNGHYEEPIRLTAADIPNLLHCCTERLSLPSAARRLFADDGTEIFSNEDVNHGALVYVSCGEPFRNPCRQLRKQSEQSRSAMWTMHGVILSQSSLKKKSKTTLSKRFRTMLDQHCKRVLLFRNGRGTDSIEIVANLNKMDEFYQTITARLELGSFARILYDWEGNEIQNLEDAPILDQCLQTWSSPVLGPLWVSKGEGFSPKGVRDFLTSLISYTKEKLRQAKYFKEQLSYAKDKNHRSEVKLAAIMSMLPEEIDKNMENVEKDIQDFTNALNRLKEQMGKISEKLQKEEEQGSAYTLQHIEQMDTGDRMVGTKGIKLKVYENGSYENEIVIFFNIQQASRGVDAGNKEKLMERLLDQCSSIPALKNNPSIRPLASRLFDKFGRDIRSVYELQNEQEVWLSYGEAWKNPFVFAMGAQFDKVRVFDIESSDSSNVTRHAARQQLTVDDGKDQDKSSSWDAIEGIPSEYATKPVERKNAAAMEEVNALLETGAIDTKAIFLRNKKRSQFLLYPEVVMDVKRQKGAVELWPSDSQIWLITKSGQICLKSFPQLVLGVSERQYFTYLTDPAKGTTEVKVEGYIVNLQKRSPGNARQQWQFTSDGYICAESHGEYVLTYLGSRLGNEDVRYEDEREGEDRKTGERYYIAVCHKVDGKYAKAQRWALKQERFDNLGQWKFTRAENPEWNKKALSWPVKEDGELNEDYDWPMEGYFVPYAPPLKNDKNKKNFGSAPLRLMVLKNGTRDISKACPVVAPDLTTMKKDTTHSKKKHKACVDDSESVEVDTKLHCDEDISVFKLEFQQFLERCTNMLGLPFAARRLFDENGEEHFTLSSLVRDQFVYVTCGEAWSDPKMNKAEQQRHYLLSNLSSDIMQIRQFVALRDPPDLLLEISEVNIGAKVIINENPAEKRQNEEAAERQPDMPVQEPVTMTKADSAKDTQPQENINLTAHERAHQNSDDWLQTRKWPWERVGKNDNNNGEQDEELEHYTNKDLYLKYKLPEKKKQEDPSEKLRHFIYDDNYIICAANRELVLGVVEQKGRISDLVLVKKRADDIFQRWLILENGLIQSKHSPQMVLTITMPVKQQKNTDANILTYAGCSVTLQKRKICQLGSANQKWRYDPETGLIHAFFTDVQDKEITAANKANVCTFAVMGNEEVDQPGYVAEMALPSKGGKIGKLLICSSCARAMRGRCKLEKIELNVDFACAMGSAHEYGMKPVGSFKCLNGKVDLSTHESLHTLDEWEQKLEQLREETSVRAIAHQIAAARTPYTAKLLVYKNGEGRLKPGHVIVGSSIPGILEQATYRLELTQAARRFYAADGTIILDLDDLIDWVKQQYVKEAKQQIKEEARRKKKQQQQQTQQANDKKTDAKKDGQNSLQEKERDSDSSDDDDEKSAQSAPISNGKLQEPPSTLQESLPNVKQITIGADSASERSNMGRETGNIIIPNPMNSIPFDGRVTSWSFYASGFGPLVLLILRPSEKNETVWTIIHQFPCATDSPGQYSLDLSDTNEFPPMEVKQGDTIAFYTLTGAASTIISYDSFKGVLPYPLKCVVHCDDDNYSALEPGTVLQMEPMNDMGRRDYSLNIVVVPVEKPVQKVKEKTKKNSTGPNVEPPPTEMVLRYPIEVWASFGEPFVKPEDVEKDFEKQQQQREEITAISSELEREKHILRHIKGRRFGGQQPGEFKGTSNPEQPVYKEGHWQEVTIDENEKMTLIDQLVTHLKEMKSRQKSKDFKCNTKVTGRLYSQSLTKRLLVFPNGGWLEQVQYVWGDSLPRLLENSTTRLNLSRPAAYVFTVDGTLVTDFNTLEKDQLVCVSATKTFLRPKESQQLVEIKANWIRARRIYGQRATDIVITSETPSHVGVDPFGPSAIASEPQMKQLSAP